MHTTSEASVIGVVGLSGGVGASTVSAALAVRAAQAGRTVLLVDGHPLGGGLYLLLGDDLQGDLGWAQLAQTRGEVDIEAVLSRLHTAAGCAVLTWCRALPRAAESAPDPSLWCQLATAVDVTVVDLPGPGRRGARPWLRGCTDVVAVVGAGVTGMAAAMAGLDALGLSRWVPAPHLAGALVRSTHDVPPTVAVARALDMPVLGVLRDDPEVHRALNAGAPVGARSGPVQRVADEILASILVGDQGAA